MGALAAGARALLRAAATTRRPPPSLLTAAGDVLRPRRDELQFIRHPSPRHHATASGDGSGDAGCPLEARYESMVTAGRAWGLSPRSLARSSTAEATQVFPTCPSRKACCV